VIILRKEINKPGKVGSRLTYCFRIVLEQLIVMKNKFYSPFLIWFGVWVFICLVISFNYVIY